MDALLKPVSLSRVSIIEALLERATVVEPASTLIEAPRILDCVHLLPIHIIEASQVERTQDQGNPGAAENTEQLRQSLICCRFFTAHLHFRFIQQLLSESVTRFFTHFFKTYFLL